MRATVVNYRIDDFYIPEEVLPKNVNHMFNCSICDRKIPRDNLHCYKCRQEYNISRDGVFKDSLPSYSKDKAMDRYRVLREDKSFPNYCSLCSRNRVKTNGGMCVRCIKFITQEEE